MANWRWIKLSHAYPRIGSGTTPPDEKGNYLEDGSGTNWVTTSELRETRISQTKKQVSHDALKRFPTLRVYKPGSVMFAMYGATIGRLGVLEQPACCNQACCVFERSRSVENRYLVYWLQHRKNDLIALSVGGGQPNLSQQDLRNERVYCPDLATQRQIADFLDRETARIDLLIEKKQKLVALLGEKVRADIHDLFQTLDAETWRIRHLGKVKNGAGFPVELQGDASNEIPFFKVKHLAVNGLDQRITDSEDTITKETSTVLRATVFPKGTIVFAKIGAALLLGRFSMLGTEGCVDNNVAAFVVNKRLADPDYLLLCFERFEMQLMVQPGTVPSLGTEKFINQSVPLPSLDDQIKLVSEVRRAFHRNERIVQRTRGSIDRLKEYRSVLITAAVTGQIDVTTYAKSGVNDRRLDAIQEEMSP